MKFIKKYPLLFWIFLFTLFISFLINFPLAQIPEKISWGNEFGKYLYDISIAYITSYIFFYLVIFLKEEKDTSFVKSRICRHSNLIVIYGYGFYRNIFDKIKKQKRTFPPSQSEIDEACKLIDPFHSPVGLNNIPNMPWEWLLKYHKKEINENIQKIKPLPYLDSELYGLLTEIEDSGLFVMTEMMIFPKIPVEHFKDGNFLIPHLKKYFEIIKKLENYVEVNFKEFKQENKIREERKKLYLE